VPFLISVGLLYCSVETEMYLEIVSYSLVGGHTVVTEIWCGELETLETVLGLYKTRERSSA
jgi:hypothetical protein